MSRAHRLPGSGGIYHLTHRCHNRAFLLKFACDRNAYRAKVREHLRQYQVRLLDYCLTSNHVHLLVEVGDRGELSAWMQCVAGEFARAYNRRKRRTNAFWGDNFHATVVEEGNYLWRCLCYIELNMVRAGVVSHPRDWEWVGYHEIMGERKRNRMLDLERLCWRLGTEDLGAVQKNLEASMTEALAREQVRREPCWTESLAVGSAGFVERMQPLIVSRQETEIVEATGGVWALREEGAPYGKETGLKSDRKNSF
jgi:putative transposase